jgi:hypothetical protein
MPHTRVEEHAQGIRAVTQFWQVEHRRDAGGAWDTITFINGSGKNLLRGPLSSGLRFVRPNPRSESGVFTGFFERNEKAPRLRIEQTAQGFPVVVAEGTYRDADGKPLPVGYRRRTEYHDYGLIWTTLDIMSESGCEEVVEVRALELPLRAGLTDAYARFHPTQDGGSDLLGGHGWFDLTRQGTAFSSRFTPLQIVCFERNVEGLELFPGSDLAQWDVGLKPELGLGLYVIAQAEHGATVELNPYCMAFRRVKMKVQGTLTFRLGIGLPFIKPPRRARNKIFHASANSRWPAKEDVKAAADAGVRLIRFHNDYREDGPFWRDGLYPPYDEANMQQLRTLVNDAHAHGMKIVPYVSLKELHPDTPEFKRSAREWMHMAAPSVDIIHTWAGSGEYGGLMCLKSGWYDFRKRSIDAILSDLPWDGLYFDWCSFHPCCHPGHARGPFHTDIEQFLDLLLYCRKRVGDGTLFLHLSGLPSIVAENMADLVFILEDQPSIAPKPGEFPPQCDFVPIAPRQLVAGAEPGTPQARRIIMGGHLQGHPTCARLPAKGFAAESLAEIALFSGFDLAQFEMFRASDCSVETGSPEVFAAAWVSAETLLLYVGNFADEPRKGRLKFPKGAEILGKKKIKWERRAPGAEPSAGTANAADLAGTGLPYELQGLGSALLIVSAK